MINRGIFRRREGEHARRNVLIDLDFPEGDGDAHLIQGAFDVYFRGQRIAALLAAIIVIAHVQRHNAVRQHKFLHLRYRAVLRIEPNALREIFLERDALKVMIAAFLDGDAPF